MQQFRPATLLALVLGFLVGWFSKSYWYSTIQTPGNASDTHIPYSKNDQANLQDNIDWHRIDSAKISTSDYCGSQRLESNPINEPGSTGKREIKYFYTDNRTGFPTDIPLLSDSFKNRLVEIGIDEITAEGIRKIIGKHRMKLLELRKTAIQEGWADTQQYLDARTLLADPDERIRARFGDEIYSRYLYASGKSNGVFVKMVYPDSQAYEIGLRPGDVILRYGDATILKISDLIKATTSGTTTESTLITFKRDNTVMHETIQRGVLGVELDTLLIPPNE